MRDTDSRQSSKTRQSAEGDSSRRGAREGGSLTAALHAHCASPRGTTVGRVGGGAPSPLPVGGPAVGGPATGGVEAHSRRSAHDVGPPEDHDAADRACRCRRLKADRRPAIIDGLLRPPARGSGLPALPSRNAARHTHCRLRPLLRRTSSFATCKARWRSRSGCSSRPTCASAGGSS